MTGERGESAGEGLGGEGGESEGEDTLASFFHGVENALGRRMPPPPSSASNEAASANDPFIAFSSRDRRSLMKALASVTASGLPLRMSRAACLSTTTDWKSGAPCPAPLHNSTHG